MKVTVDRIEESFCVCVTDDERIFNILSSDFPFEVHPCDILDITLDGDKLKDAVLLKEETEAAKSLAKRLMQRLRNKKRG